MSAELQRSCVYCGARLRLPRRVHDSVTGRYIGLPADAPARLACDRHRPLLALDPHYSRAARGVSVART